jgi:TPR repeat protein
MGGAKTMRMAALTALKRSATEHNSKIAQYTIGMIEGMQCAGSDRSTLEMARWVRVAAHQGLKEAQWELGEMFRFGVFCDIDMRLVPPVHQKGFSARTP